MIPKLMSYKSNIKLTVLDQSSIRTGGTSKKALRRTKSVAKILSNMATGSAADEFVILTICHDPVARRKSYELITKAFIEI